MASQLLPGSDYQAKQITTLSSTFEVSLTPSRVVGEPVSISAHNLAIFVTHYLGLTQIIDMQPLPSCYPSRSRPSVFGTITQLMTS